MKQKNDKILSQDEDYMTPEECVAHTCVAVDNQPGHDFFGLSDIELSSICANSINGFANSIKGEYLGESNKQPSIQTVVLSEVERSCSHYDGIDNSYSHEDHNLIHQDTNSCVTINDLTHNLSSQSFFNNSSASLYGDMNKQENVLSFNEMALALVALDTKIKKKNTSRLFNCCLINCQDNDNELSAFFGLLKANHQKLHSQRIQVIYLKEMHWSLLDIDITESGLSFILYDDANSLKYIIPLLLNVRDLFPEATLAYLASNFQKDSNSCAYFALHAIENLTKINNLHQVINRFPSEFTLKNSVEDLRQHSDDEWTKQPDKVLTDLINQVQYINMCQWPLELGSLVKTIQSCSYFEEFIEKKNYLRHNGKSLNNYLKNKTDESTGIAATKKKINKLIEELPESSDGYQSCIDHLCDWRARLVPLCADSHELKSIGSISK